MRFYNLFEGKNIGDLYHLVSFGGMEFVLKTNSLKFKQHYENEDYEYISLTRDPNLTRIYGVGSGGFGGKSFRLIIDGNKLSNNYKIVPYSAGEDWEDEREERVITSEIKNVFKYIKGIVIFTIPPFCRSKYKEFGINTLEDLKNFKGAKNDHIKINRSDTKNDYKILKPYYDIITELRKTGVKLYAQNIQENGRVTDDLSILDNCFFIN